MIYRTITKSHILRSLRNDIARRTFCSSSAENPKERKKKQARADAGSNDESAPNVISSKFAKDFEEYIGHQEYRTIVDHFPTDLFKRSQNAEKFYLVSSERADAISKYVTDGLSTKTKLVEVNPGAGLLTKKLLQETDNILLYESDERFKPDLEKLLNDYKKMQLRFLDFNGHWRQSYMDIMDQQDRMANMFQDLPKQRRWKDDVNYRLFSVVGSLRFFKTLINSVATQSGIFRFGRCEMILAVPPLLYAHLTCGSDAGYKLYRCSSVLFQIFFEHEFIAKIPRRAFLPWPSNPSPRKSKTLYHRLGLVGSDDLYLMRIEPRRNLFDFCLPDNLKLLMFFVSQNMISRKKQVIPALERWIPFCGARLIVNPNYHHSAPDTTPSSPTKESKAAISFPRTSSPLRENDFPERMTIFTEFGELSPSQMLTVFNEFINWPEFQQSPFLQSMEQHYSKQTYGRQNPAAAASAPADSDPVIDEDEEQLLSDETMELKPAVNRRNRS